ncbi:MAG: phage holin family protein [Paracoccaceae bacterium]
MTPNDPPKSAGEIVADIMNNVGNLVRNEVDLARSEIATSVSRAAVALRSMVLAVVLLITGINVLAAALVIFAVGEGVPILSAAIVVGVGLLIAATAIFFSAKTALGRVGLVPTRAVHNIQRDATTLKEAYYDN